MAIFTGALVKGMIGGAIKERASKIGKSKVGKLLGREKNIMMGKPQPKVQVGAPAQTVQPQQTLAPVVSDVGEGEGGGGPKSFATEKEAAIAIKNSTIQVATLLKGSYVLQKEQLKNKRKSKEKEKRAKDEKGLEKGPKLGGKIKMPKLPGKGLIDKIFGFIGTIVFGWLALKLVDWMPTLENILPKLGMAADWVIGAGIWIVDALANVIHFGYTLVDTMEGWVKNVFGEEGAEKFTTFMTNLKNLFTGFLIWKIIGQKIFKAIISNIKFAFGIAKSIVVNAGRVLNFLTGGAAGRIGGAITKGIGSVFTRLSGGVFSRGMGRAGGRLALKVFGKGGVKAFAGIMAKAKGIFGKVPIIGPLIIGIVSLLSGEPLGQALFKTFGAAIGGFLGTFIPIPVLGTLIGETIGVFVGDLLYDLIMGGGVEAVGQRLKDTFTTMLKGGKVVFNWLKDGFVRLIDGLPKNPFRLGTFLVNPFNIVDKVKLLAQAFFSREPMTASKSAKDIEAEEKRKEMLDAMKKKVGNVTGAVTGAAGKAWNWITGGGDEQKGKVIKNALKKKNDKEKKKVLKITGITATGYLVGTGDDQREIIPKGVRGKEHHAESYARHVGGTETRDASGRLKSQQIFEYDGKKYHPDDPLYDIARAAAISVRDGNEKLASALHFKLVTANKQGGAKAVIDSISTTASYDEKTPQTVVVSDSGSQGSEMPQKSKSSEPLSLNVSGDSVDPYEALYKGS